MSDELWKTIPLDLAQALRVATRENTLDVYEVRESELLGWDGPRVLALSHAAQVIANYAAPPEEAAPLSYEAAVEMLPEADRERILAALKAGGA